MNRSHLEANLKRFEGFRGKPYKDTKGKTTIGFGRNLDDVPLTEAEGWILSKGPLDDAIEHAPLLVHYWDNLGDARQNILIELVYNIGFKAAAKFQKMRIALDTQNWPEAARQLLDSDWKTDVGPTRSVAMAKQLDTGEWA